MTMAAEKFLFFALMFMPKLVMATDCTDNKECTEGSTCCSWDGIPGKYAMGTCGEICAAGAFTPTLCMQDADCDKPSVCCNVGKASGSCGEVCIVGSVRGQNSTENVSTTTCGDIKEMYKNQSCCGNPSKPFVVPEERRLTTASYADDEARVMEVIRKVLFKAQMSGDAAKARQLANKIKEQMQPYMG